MSNRKFSEVLESYLDERERQNSDYYVRVYRYCDWAVAAQKAALGRTTMTNDLRELDTFFEKLNKTETAK